MVGVLQEHSRGREAQAWRPLLFWIVSQQPLSTVRRGATVDDAKVTVSVPLHKRPDRAAENDGGVSANGVLF